MAIAVALLVTAVAGFWLWWRRRTAPIPIGDGIRAIGRIGLVKRAPDVNESRRSTALRRQHVRLASSVVLCVLAGLCLVSAQRRSWALLFVLVLLLRIASELLARQRSRSA